jgi:stage II sporulation protein GA (sporulation sigma-E factor processing peptidase)
LAKKQMGLFFVKITPANGAGLDRHRTGKPVYWVHSRVGLAMIVYVDLVFLTNLAVDGTVLLATARTRRLKPARWRVSSAALLGASYAAVLFWADVPYLYSLAAKVAVSLLMVLIAFGYGGPLAYARSFGVFYTVNFVTLGGVLGLGALLRSSGSPWSGVTFTEHGGLLLDWRMQLALFAVSFILSLLLFRRVSESGRKHVDTDALLWRAEILIEGERWELPALMDTGNRLFDPISRTPVMIMEAAVWRERLPEGWGDRLLSEPADRIITECGDEVRDSFAWMHRLRLVPYRGVGGVSRLMLTVKPDDVLLSREGHPPLKAGRVLIGLDGGTLSSDGAYRAILHPEMLAFGTSAPKPSQPA